MYIKKFQYDTDALMTFEVGNDRSPLEDTFKELISIIKIGAQGYNLSDVGDLINVKLCEKLVVRFSCFPITVPKRIQDHC